jgi:hypothetical protein
MNKENNNKQVILNTVEDLVLDFLYNDRENDYNLKLYDIEYEIYSGNMTIDEIVEAFRNELVSNLQIENVWGLY